jgi:hypothetical protein
MAHGWTVVAAEAFTRFIPEGFAASSGDRGSACAPLRCAGIDATDLIKTSIMSIPPVYRRITAWFHAHRMLRWVETIATDFSDWNPLN